MYNTEQKKKNERGRRRRNLIASQSRPHNWKMKQAITNDPIKKKALLSIWSFDSDAGVPVHPTQPQR